MAKRRNRKGSYKLTAKRRVALKKAQTVSARKRKAAPNKPKSNTRRNIAIATVSVGALTTAGIVARHRLSGSSFSKTTHANISSVTGKQLPSGRRFSINKTGISLIQANGSNKTRFAYNHKRLKREDVLGARINSSLTKRRNRQLAQEHMLGGKKIYHGPRKYVGGKELFTEIGASGKIINSGFTSMGNALSGRKG